MAQHLLVAADQFELGRLRAICEQRLCETVDEASVATTLTLAEQNHAGELKRVCLEYISSSDKLSEIMASEGFQHMVASCPHLQVCPSPRLPPPDTTCRLVFLTAALLTGMTVPRAYGFPEVYWPVFVDGDPSAHCW